MSTIVKDIIATSVALTDAQIKALPTTPIEIIPAPGIGKILFPVSGLVSFDSIAGAYTNLGYFGNGITDMYMVSDAYNYFFGHIDMGQLYAGLHGDKVNIWLNQYAAQSFIAGDYEVTAGAVSAGEPKSPKYLPGENLPIILKMDNYTEGYGEDLGNLTGGNVANTIKITICYITIDL